MRARKNISLKERKSLTFSDFTGVDFSSSHLRVKKNRASYMRNFINEDGVNKKRNGWKQIGKLEGQIDGIFQFKDTIIAYAGGEFYYGDAGGFGKLSAPDGTKLSPGRIQVFFNKGKAYIIGCGDYLVCECESETAEPVLNRVADVAYVPTTTISIDNDSVDDTARSTLDDVNCLCSRRKNQLNFIPKKRITVGSIDANTEVIVSLYSKLGEKIALEYTLKNFYFDKVKNAVVFGEELFLDDTSGIYRLYGSIDFGLGVIEINHPNLLDCQKVVYQYTSGGTLKNDECSLAPTWTLDANIDKSTFVEILLETLEDGEAVSYTITNKNADKTYGTTLHKVKKNDSELDEELDEEKECGSLTWGDDKNKATVTLTCSVIPQIENRDNIFVTFQHKNDETMERITKCKFGTLFGVDGNNDRLFLSGNPNYPNMDFHSEEDDFTYFSDRGYARLGSDSSAIKGYGRLSDSNLAIYKEDNEQESAIFYRAGYYDTKYDSDGVIESMKGVFTHKAGNAGEGCISTYACANLGGDSLLLSQNGVFGVVLSNNVATAERYLRERSRNINEKLRKHKKLSDAVGIVYKNRYYLSVDGVCYVADARHKFAAENDLDGSYNYEWWYWDNIPARVFAIINDKLYFGTADGRICEFDDKYTDRTVETYTSGAFSINIDNNTITNSHDISLAENDIIRLESDAEVYSLLLESKEYSIEDGKIKIKDDYSGKIYDFREGIYVYLDNCPDDSGLNAEKEYTIRDIDRGAKTLSLCGIDGGLETPIELKTGGFNIYQSHQGEELYVTNVIGFDTFQLKKHKLAKNALKLSLYNGTAPCLGETTTLVFFKNVVAEWRTPTLDLGTNESSKTLLKMTVATEPETNGKLSFGYRTRKSRKDIEAKGINVFSFENLSFTNFTFNTGFANSYSVKCNERNFNFIEFGFTSDNDSDCRLNSLEIIYKINKSNIGVM